MLWEVLLAVAAMHAVVHLYSSEPCTAMRNDFLFLGLTL